MKYIIDIEPMAAVRMTQRSKWTSEKAQRYLDFKESVAWHLKSQRARVTKAACGVKVIFYMPIPQSWSKLRQISADNGYVSHIVKPDIDNLIKACFDSANKILWEDDNQVIECRAKKAYSNRPRIEIELEELF